MTKHLEIDDQQFRDLVIQAVTEMPQGKLDYLSIKVVQLAQERGLAPPGRDYVALGIPMTPEPPSLSEEDFKRFVDVVWQLVNEGIIRPGIDGPNMSDLARFNLPYYTITSKGTKQLESQHS